MGRGAPPVRLLALSFLVLMLAGCVADEKKAEDPLFAVCPQWIEGGAVEGSVSLENGPATVTLAPEQNGTLAADLDGFPLDLYVFTVSTSSPVRVHAATTDGRNLLLRDASAAEPESRPSLTVQEEANVAVYLTAVAHGSTPDPSGVTLTLEAEDPAEVTVSGTAWYRVCGAIGTQAQKR